ncbi:MAG: site-specific integrase [Bacteroidales bacterium]|nr:site-specific integrase [Bacteroidales bacterium]MCF8456723.1 site-specific integrase [Bacteroidales bacterium]
MKISVKWMLWAQYVKMDGRCTICFRVTINRKTKYYWMPFAVLPRNWDERKALVKSNEPGSNRVNLYLEKEKLRVDEIAWDLQMKKKVSLFEFDKAYLNQAAKTDFVGFCKQVYSDTIRFKPGTVRTHQPILKRVSKYKPDLLISEIDQELIRDFKNYLLNTLSLELSTAEKTLKTMQARLNDAKEKGIITENPFDKIKYTATNASKQYLIGEEIERLEKLYEAKTLGNTEQKVLQHFLFQCYTSLGYAELKKLRKEDIQIEMVNGQRSEFIRLMREKTGKPISVPLIDRAKEMLKTGFDIGPVFRPFTNQTMNEYLKAIMVEAKIHKSITTHCARYTFSTIGLEKGIPFDVISNILGHEDFKTTHIYATYTDRLKAVEMEKMNTKKARQLS